MGRAESVLEVTAVMNRVRKAIRDFDPSYRLKARGWICAKEWREIMPHYIKLIAGVKIDTWIPETIKAMEKTYGTEVVRYFMNDPATQRGGAH